MSKETKTEPTVSQQAEPTPQSADAEEKNQTNATKNKRALVKRRKGIRVAIGVISFAAGLILGPYVGEMMARATPGFFGPDNQQVIEDQNANFDRLESKLEELKLTAGDDPKTAALIKELREALAEQRALAKRKNEMFKEVDIERQMLRDQLTEVKQGSQSVGFWIGEGESISLKDRTKVFSFRRVNSVNDSIQAVISGQRTPMEVGDVVEVDTAEGKMLILYRHGRRESDGRFGFDVTPADALSKND